MDFPGKSQDQSSAQEVSLRQRLTGASAEAEPGPRVYCGGFIAPGSSSSSCGIDSSTVCTGLEQGAASQKLVSLSTLGEQLQLSPQHSWRVPGAVRTMGGLRGAGVPAGETLQFSQVQTW